MPIKWLAIFFCAPLFAATTIDVGSLSENVCGGSRWLIPVALLAPGTTDATLRFSDQPFSCHALVAPGSYSVTLRFVEPAVPGDSRLSPLPHRVFSATINGLPVVDRLELVGSDSRTATVASSGFLDVAFTTQTRAAVISSIEYAPIQPPQTAIDVGSGLMSTSFGGRQTLSVDTAYILHLGQYADKPEPIPGSGCNDSGAVVVGQDAVYFCAAVLPLSANPQPWGRWLKVPGIR